MFTNFILYTYKGIRNSRESVQSDKNIASLCSKQLVPKKDRQQRSKGGGSISKENKKIQMHKPTTEE